MAKTPTPVIFTYLTTDPAAPPEMKAAASLDRSGPGLHWIAFGPTEEAARATLDKFWQDHEAKAEHQPRKPKAEGAADHVHEWRVWPETDGQSQRCAGCGAYRDTPEEDKTWLADRVAQEATERAVQLATQEPDQGDDEPEETV